MNKKFYEIGTYLEGVAPNSLKNIRRFMVANKQESRQIAEIVEIMPTYLQEKISSLNQIDLFGLASFSKNLGFIYTISIPLEYRGDVGKYKVRLLFDESRELSKILFSFTPSRYELHRKQGAGVVQFTVVEKENEDIYTHKTLLASLYESRNDQRYKIATRLETEEKDFIKKGVYYTISRDVKQEQLASVPQPKEQGLISELDKMVVQETEKERFHDLNMEVIL